MLSNSVFLLVDKMFRKDNPHDLFQGQNDPIKVDSGMWDNLNLTEARELLDWLDNHPEFRSTVIALAPDC